jgi:hypothetical protein
MHADFWWKNLWDKGHLGDRKGAGRIILRWIKYAMKAVGGWNWLGTVSSVVGFAIRGFKASNSANREEYS